MSVYWELPLSNGYRYVSNTVCLAGTNAGNSGGRVHDEHLDVYLRDSEGRRVRRHQFRGLDEALQRKLIEEIKMMDVRYVMLDFKTWAYKEPSSLDSRFGQNEFRNRMRDNPTEATQELYREVRNKLKFFRKVVEQTPWMKACVKIDVIRMRVYVYTNVPCDQWFNSASFIKNGMYYYYSKNIAHLMSLGLNEANAVKMCFSWSFGFNAITNQVSDPNPIYSSDTMCGHTPSMSTQDIRNLANGVIYPYGKNLRGSGGYPKFGNSVNRNLHIEHNYSYRSFERSELRGGIRLRNGQYNMYEMFSTPANIAAEDADNGYVGGYYLHHFGPNTDEDYLRRQMRQYLPNQVVEDHINGTRPLMTRTEMFNYWVRIMLEEQNRGNTPNE